MVARPLGVASVVLAAWLSSASAQSTCGQYDFATPFVEAWMAAEEFAGSADATEKIKTLADGACHQETVIAALEQRLGGRAGYKAGATSPLMQKQFGLDRPLLGVLFRDGILRNGATVRSSDGARLVVELDLAVRVGTEAINEAQSRDDALAGVDAFVPLIEVGDLMVPRGVKITGGLLQAMNLGARFAVAGDLVTVVDDDATMQRLGTLKAHLRDAAGRPLIEGDGSALLGHPLDAVLFIVDEAKARGWRLRKGDLLSLGSFGRFIEVSPGARLTAVYEGLGETAARATVTIR